jgi:NAD(P)-dependent dehydrogenase (short-subunit alcohol dehydrogenase family)
MGRLSGKVVLVTGGGSGLGRATAVLAAAADATVVVTDVNAKGGAETVALAGQRAHFVSHDTSKTEDWSRVLSEIETRFGMLHGLVNNAGILGPMPAPVHVETLDGVRKIFAVNVEGVFLGCKLAMPLLRKAGGASIVNLSSIAGLIGTPALASYGMSKAAVRQLTKSVAIECARGGTKVRCNSVHPGIIETPMGEELLADPVARQARLANIPLGHFGAPEDIGHAIVFLLSDEARYITGAELVIDGGITAI